MIEYDVRDCTCNDDDSQVRISFGEYGECLEYDKSDSGVFSIYHPRSDEGVVISSDDINYMIRALEKLKEIKEIKENQ